MPDLSEPFGDYVLRELRTTDPREAELLADMWNRSDEGWPGGWTGGVALTAERIHRDFMTSGAFGQWVVEHAGEIVGYVNLYADPEHPRNAYVGLLSARPDHHGHGVGRHLVQRTVNRSIEAGLEKVDLGTWAGNLKAVPLYKKTGFFWSPETSVHMENFVPTIVRMPLLAGFFREHDWYRVQERDLSVGEDVEVWHGVRVYHYRFAAAGRRIEVLIDRQAQMPAMVETDEVSLAAWVGTEDLAVLEEHTLTYELRSKCDRPVRVSILARGETGVPVSVQESFELKGRRTLRIPFRLPADPERKRPGEPPHRVLSTITVDGVPVQLGTAVAGRDAVEIEYSGQGVAAGVWSDVFVRLRNRLPFPVSGTIWVGLPGGVGRDEERLGFRIPRSSWGCASMKVRVPEPGAVPADMQVSFSDETAARLAQGETPARAPLGRKRTAWLRAFAPGRPAISQDVEERQITIETDRALVTLSRVGGHLRWTHKSPWCDAIQTRMPIVGPPFTWFHGLPPIYDVDVSQAEGGIRLTMRHQERRFPGLELERTIFVRDDALELRLSLINRGDDAAEAQLRFGFWGGKGTALFTLPERGRLVQYRRDGWSDWPRGDELKRQSREFAETWVASEDQGVVTGLVWSGDYEVYPSGGGADFTTPLLSVPPRGSVEMAPIHAIAGPGDWQRVRAFWANYVKEGRLTSPEEREPRRDQALTCRFTEPLPILDGGDRELTIELRTEKRRPCEGVVRLRLPAAVSLPDGGREAAFPVAGLAKGHPQHQAVSLRPTRARACVSEAELTLEDQRRTHTFRLPLLTVRPDAEGRLCGDSTTVAFDSGEIAFCASSGHAGSIVSLKRGGREMLHSSFPEPRAYRYQNPWYGGIRASSGSGWQRALHLVERSIEPVEAVGTSGRRWCGALVRARPRHKDWGWLRYSVRYLGTAGSNLLAVMLEVRRTTPAPAGLWNTAEVWPHEGTKCAYVERDGRPVIARPDCYEYGVEERNWLALDCGRAGYLAVVPRRQPGWHAGVENLGDGQFQAEAGMWADLTPPVRSLTALLWVVPCGSLEEAFACRHLRELQALP